MVRHIVNTAKLTEIIDQQKGSPELIMKMSQTFYVSYLCYHGENPQQQKIKVANLLDPNYLL